MKVATSDLLPLIEEEATKLGISPVVAKAMFLSENSSYDRGGNLVSRSAVDTLTTSPKGAQGLMQVMPDTVKGLANQGYLSPLEDLSSVRGQIRAGLAAIKEAQARGIGKDNPTEQAIYYNGGPAALKAYKSGKQMNPETTEYVKKFTTHLGGDSFMASPEEDVVPTSFAAAANARNLANTQRESISVSQHILPEGAAEELRSKQRSFSALSSTLQTQLGELSAGMLATPEKIAAAADKANTAKVAQIEADAGVVSATQDSKNQILSEFGINLNDPDTIIGKNVQVIQSTRNERMDLQNQIAAAKGTATPFTDPIGWLMSSFRQLPLIQRHNALAVQENDAIANISSAQALAAQQTAIQPASLKESLNQKKIADANAAIAEGEQRKEAALIAARSHVAQFIIERQRMTGEDLSKLIQVDNILGQTTTTAYSSTEKKSESDKAADEQLKPLHLLTDSMGLPRFTKFTFSHMDKPTQDRWLKMAQFGRAGVSPGDSLATMYDTYGGPGLAQVAKEVPAAGALMQHVIKQGQAELELLETQAVANPKIANQLKNAKDPSARLAFGVDSWMKKKEAEADPEKSDFSKLTADNPYKLNYGYAAAQGALKENPIAQRVAAVPKGIAITDQILLATAVADVANADATKRKPVGQVAQEVFDFYSKGMSLQSSDQRAEQIGLKPRTNYPVMAKVNTFFSQKVDLFNRESIERWLVQQAASGKVNEALAEPGALTPFR